MHVKQKRHDEAAAARIVAAVTGCTARPLDPGGGSIQLADYVLQSKSGATLGLLEVTSITDRVAAQFWSARTAQHRAWQDGELRRNWHISVRDTGVVLKPVRDAVTSVLREFESTGVDLACVDPSDYHSRLAAALPPRALACGVVRIKALPQREDQQGVVFVNAMPSGSFYGIVSLTVEVEAEARKEDNRRKLNGELERRELFIWANPGPATSAVSVITGFSEAVYRDDVESTRPPTLPPEITAVWAAGLRRRASALALVLWRGDRRGWRVCRPAN